ncbi:MAG: hypothetical protein ABIG03_02260 [Candidatus Eisenbacteria bacterium]
MRTLTFLAVFAVLLSVPAADASGFGLGPNPWSGLDFKPVVGHWAEYQMTPAGEEPMTMRVSIVGQENDDYWYETVVTVEKQGQVITKMLVSGDPQDQKNLKRMIMKPAGEPAMEMPVQMMQGMGGPPQGEMPELPETAAVDLGVESVTVPAGTFKANHWQFTTEDFVFDSWISADVSPYGVVRGVSKEFEMVLLSHGDGAKSLITEEPQAMSMPGFSMPGSGGK